MNRAENGFRFNFLRLPVRGLEYDLPKRIRAETIAALMKPSGISMRPLYWLALFQLVAGPLALVTVMTFCKLTVREVPTHGVAAAMSRAWQSEEFQAVLAASQDGAVDAAKSSQPKPEPKVKKDGGKLTWIAWQPVRTELAVPAREMNWGVFAETWTPSWSQAPPGPPPRVG